MRRVSTALGLAVLLALTGCNNMRWNFLRSPDKPPPPTQTPTAEQLVSYLNANSQRIQAVRFTDIDLTASEGDRSYNLPAKMICQSPRTLVLTAALWCSPATDRRSSAQ